MGWLILIVLLLAAGVVYVYHLCEPSTIYNTKKAHGYIVLNTITQIPCYGGRQYRTVRQADKARSRLWDFELGDGKSIFEIRKVL